MVTLIYFLFSPPDEILPRKNRYAQAGRKLRSVCDVAQDENHDISAADAISLCHKVVVFIFVVMFCSSTLAV